MSYISWTEQHRTHRSAFTIVEMLTTVAVLIIVLGLMVSLARYVRARSAQELTTQTLADLDVLMSKYINMTGGETPPVTPFVPESGSNDETALRHRATANNREVVRALKNALRAGGLSAFDKLPIAIYDEITLRDAWGNPIVFMPQMHARIGMAPQNRPFFFSAGPDRKFLTIDDNLYSYDVSKEAVAPEMGGGG